MAALNTLPYSFQSWPLKHQRSESKGSETAPLPHGLLAARGGQVLLSWVLLHGNMRRGRRMQREGTGPTTTREEFTSGEETKSKVTAKGGDREDKARGGRIRGMRERRKMEVQPSSSHRSIVFQGKCYWKARHGGENRACCYEILHSTWGLKGSSFGWVQPYIYQNHSHLN